MRAVLDIILIVLDLYIWLLIAAAILSWLIAFNVVNTRNQFVAAVAEFLYRITEPVLAPIRSFIPAFGGLEQSFALGTVGAALEAFDVEGGVRIVLLAPSLDDQLIGPAAAERARQWLGRPLNRVSVHVGELLGVKWTHGDGSQCWVWNR